MTPICTFEDHNLGDQLVFLHLLRSLAKANPSRTFWHFTHAHHCTQLAAVVQDIANIELFSFESAQWQQHHPVALNVWKNFNGVWERSKLRWDWSAFTLWHHQIVAGLMRLRSPLSIREDLLFDYPALNPNAVGGMYFYDVLFVNGEPCSGQFGPMREHGTGYLSEIIRQVSKKARVITTDPVFGIECTRDTKKSITDIGLLSLMCRHHIMIATGPMWATINTTNHHHSADRLRVALLDNGEKLNLPNIVQCSTREELFPLLREKGLL